MTVAELIEELKKLEQYRQVRFFDSRCGKYVTVSEVTEVDISFERMVLLLGNKSKEKLVGGA
jgi:hypothetical protein